jgi:hypothetical protein
VRLVVAGVTASSEGRKGSSTSIKMRWSKDSYLDDMILACRTFTDGDLPLMEEAALFMGCLLACWLQLPPDCQLSKLDHLRPLRQLYLLKKQSSQRSKMTTAELRQCPMVRLLVGRQYPKPNVLVQCSFQLA